MHEGKRVTKGANLALPNEVLPTYRANTSARLRVLGPRFTRCSAPEPAPGMPRGTTVPPLDPPYRLFVDHERNPDFLTFLATQGVHDLTSAGPWVTVRSQFEAQQVMTARGLPELISFGHEYGSPEAGSGAELARWLVARAQDGLIDLRALNSQVHSRDLVGRVNIRGVLDAYLLTLA